VQFSRNSFALRPSSSDRCARSKSSVPVCDVHSGGTNTMLRSKPLFPRPQPPQKPHDCQPDRSSPESPGRAAATDSRSKNNRAFAMPLLRQTARRSLCPRSGVPVSSLWFRQLPLGLYFSPAAPALSMNPGRKSWSRSLAPSTQATQSFCESAISCSCYTLLLHFDPLQYNRTRSTSSHSVHLGVLP